jgi:hypothetical protein
MEKAQKPSNSECYTPSSEPFRIYLDNFSLKTEYTYQFLRSRNPRLTAVGIFFLLWKEIIINTKKS